MRYDGAGRRISCAVQNQGDLDVTYHAYYDGQSEIESRNGSDQVLRQYVWGNLANQYIDELCQVALNQDPWNASAGSPTENDVERFFYALHDANYNVIGVTTHAGRLIERYEYTPYGQRQVYTHGWLMSDLDGDGVVDSADESIVSAGIDPAADLDGDGDIDSADLALVQADLGQALPASDPLVTHPAAMNFRGDLAQTSGVALCPVGHQGLIHDEELSVGDAGSLIYNRTRHLHPRLGRFMQRDPLGYVDGMSVYMYVQSSPVVLNDPLGLSVQDDEFGHLKAKFDEWYQELRTSFPLDHLKEGSVEKQAAAKLLRQLQLELQWSGMVAAGKVGWQTGKQIAGAHPALAPFVTGIDATLAASGGYDSFLQFVADQALSRIRAKGDDFFNEVMDDLGVETEWQLLQALKELSDSVTPEGTAARSFAWRKTQSLEESHFGDDADCFDSWVSLLYKWDEADGHMAVASGEYCLKDKNDPNSCDECHNCVMVIRGLRITGLRCNKVNKQCD